VPDCAALFVHPRGVYSDLPDVDPWPEQRDARLYPGVLPAVAHPPCERWGRFWSADGSSSPGNDGGCFEAALRCVRTWGGVIEHPEGSHAFRVFDLPQPTLGCWTRGLFCGGYSTAVAQRNYGHRARKMTWLYYVGQAPPPPLDWTDPGSGHVYLSQPGRCSQARPRKTCPCDRCKALYGADWVGQPDFVCMPPTEMAATPIPFRDLLLSMARNSRNP